MSQNRPTQIDARGPRFGATVTTIVLAAIFVLQGSAAATALLVIQAIVFGLGALIGVHAQPYGVFFAKVIRPRLAPATNFEAPEPPRFAQFVGLLFVVAALVGIALDAPLLTQIAVGFALAAAFLNAAFAFCLGCEMYLIIKRITTASTH